MDWCRIYTNKQLFFFFIKRSSLLPFSSFRTYKDVNAKYVKNSLRRHNTTQSNVLFCSWITQTSQNTLILFILQLSVLKLINRMQNIWSLCEAVKKYFNKLWRPLYRNISQRGHVEQYFQGQTSVVVSKRSNSNELIIGK